MMGKEASGGNRAGNWIVRLGVRLIRLYQRWVSPRWGRVCRFEPSCSEYARMALERHGLRRGLRLAANRLWRCRPTFPGGYDPVPDDDFFDLPTFEIAEDGDD